MKALILVIAMLASFQSQARSTGTRGGGDAVICNQGKPNQTVEVLDYFEALEMGLTLDLGPENLSYQEKLKMVFNRWSKLDPIMAETFGKFAARFEQDMALLDRSSLPEIDDSGEQIIPKNGCFIKQMAVSRLENLAVGEKKYLVDKSLWRSLNNTQKAGLVIHEVMWSVYKRSNEKLKDSSIIRRFNSILSSTIISEYTAEDYLDFIRNIWREVDKSGVRGEIYSTTPSILYKGITYTISFLLNIVDEKVQRGTLPIVTEFTVADRKIYVGGWGNESLNYIKFYPSGAVQEARLSKALQWPTADGGMLELPGGGFSRLNFQESGLITDVESSRIVMNVYYQIQNPTSDLMVQPVFIFKGVRFPIYKAEFYQSENIKSITFDKDFFFLWENKDYKLQKSDRIFFNEDGSIQKIKKWSENLFM